MQLLFFVTPGGLGDRLGNVLDRVHTHTHTYTHTHKEKKKKKKNKEKKNVLPSFLNDNDLAGWLNDL